MYHINKESIGNGENIALQNTAKHYFKKFDILGNSKQETREGYNLVDFSSKGNFENDIFTTSGTLNYGYTGFDITDIFKNNAGKTLYFSCESFDFSNSNKGSVQLVYTKDGTSDYNGVLSNTGVFKPLIIPTDTSNVTKAVLLVFYNNTNTSGTTYTTKLTKPMLAFEENLPYEQYGASPSIEHEAPIESVGDNINEYNANAIFPINSNGLTTTKEDDGSVTINGTATANVSCVIGTVPLATIEAMNGKEYTLSLEESGIGSVSNTGLKHNGNDRFIVTSKSPIKSGTFNKVDTDTKDYSWALWIISGTVFTNYNLKLKLSKGTSTGAYSPYGQGSIEIYNGNKNLFNKDTVIQNSFIGANGGIATQEGIFYSDYIFVKENEYINISGRGDWRSFALYDKNKTFIKRDSVASDNTSYLIPTGCKYIRINGEMSNIDIIQVEEGINQTDFVAHQSQTKALYTQQPFRAIGDVKDRFVKVDGVWYEEHDIKRVLFNGTENWSKSSNINIDRYIIKIEDKIMTEHSGVLTNYFKQVNSWSLYEIGTCISGAYGTAEAVYFDWAEYGTSTLDEFKTWLSELYEAGTPLYVDYVTETPQLIECTAEQVEVLEYLNKEIKSYDEQTNISSTDAISPIFDVTAYQRISEEFKTRLKEGKITRGYLKVLATDTLPELIIDENNYLKDLKIEELRYVPEEGFIGGAVAKRVTGNFNNVDNSFDIQDREVEVYLGVELEDETTEYIKYGTYIVQRPEDDQVNDNTSFEALDYMVKFNQKYKDRITYPCKLKELLNDVLDQAGVNSKVNTFANSDFIVENNQFEQGTTLRDAIKAIAQMAFNWARIDEDDNFVMDFEMNENIDEELGTDDYFSFKKSDDYGPVNVIVLRNSQVEGENVTIKDEESILQHGEIEYVISDNPFAYTELKRKQLIEAGRRLFGLRYTPMTVDMLGLMYLNAKDRISVENSNGEKFNTYLLDHTIDYTGIVLDSMQSQAKTKTETKYQYISSLAQGLSQVEIKVDKANKKIESIVQTQEDVSEKVAKTVARIEVVYALSDSPTTAPTEGWSTTAPEWTAGKYMWQKTITTYANGTTAETAATNISGAKGEAGQNGIGITQTNITYQKSTSGTTVPTGTWQTTIPEVNEDGYLWTRTEFIYSDGSKKYAYNVGKKGATGIGVKSLVDQYYLSTSNTEQTGGEWTETQPEWQDKTYIWTRTKINWTDNSITYTDPVLANTLNDINSNIVVLRELSSSQIVENGKIITRIEETTKSLNNDYSTTEQVDSKINGLEDKYKTLEKRFVDIEASNKEYAIKINAIDNNGVDKVKTLMGYTFNDKGLNIDRPEADTGTIVDEAGIQVVDKTGAGDPTDILYAGYVKEDNTKYADYAGQTIVATSNLIVKNFLVIGSNSRFQDYTNPILGGQGTGVYDI